MPLENNVTMGQQHLLREPAIEPTAIRMHVQVRIAKATTYQAETGINHLM
jgi:hypothetical protein